MFAIWLKPFRESLGYSQARCAALAGVDVTQWERWDNGRNTPRTDNYPTIAKGLEYGRWQDWLKDFNRFASAYPEYIDIPWNEEMGQPIFVRNSGQSAVDRSDTIRDPTKGHYNIHGERPLPLVVERMMNLPLDQIASRAKREELEKRQRNLIHRAALLEEDMLQLSSAAAVRLRKRLAKE